MSDPANGPANGPRVLLVARRYWPQVGSAVTLMASLARELRQRGARPLVLTAQVENTWPTEVLHREIPVVRLPHPKARLWGSYRYLAHVGRWLAAHKSEFDLVYVSGLRYDAYTVVGALAGSGVPVVLRAEKGGLQGDCAWQRRAGFGTRVRRHCQAAQAIVAPSDSVAAELRAAGYATNRIHVIRNGVAISAARNLVRRDAARSSLLEAHPIFGLADDAPLAVCVCPFREGSGHIALVDAWPAVQRRWPQAKLWLVGDGPQAEKIWRQIVRNELKHDVLMTGLFDDLEDVFSAADLLVHPAQQGGPSLVLLEAMAAGVPIVATDIPSTRELVDSAEQALLVPPTNPAALAGAIEQVLADGMLGEQLVAAARARIEAQFTVERMAAEHLALFGDLLANGRR